MQENAEYCTGQDFQICLTVQPPTIYPGGFRLWQCKTCAYQFTQYPISDEMPSFPLYHPQPIPKHFLVTEEQKKRLRTLLEQEDRTMSEPQVRTYWAGDTAGKQCDVPDCPNMAQITKLSQTDDKIRLCHTHKDLMPETVIEQHRLWLESL